MIAANSILFSILWAIALFILMRLWKSPDRSNLRKRLIWYFISEVWLMTGLILLEVLAGYKMQPITQYVLFGLFLPKLPNKILFFLEIVDYEK